MVLQEKQIHRALVLSVLWRNGIGELMVSLETALRLLISPQRKHHWIFQVPYIPYALLIMPGMPLW